MNSSLHPGSTPARIALCITELDPGGAERALVELATRLDRRKFEPLVYCLGPRPTGNPDSLADHLERAGITVHCFGARGLAHLPRVLRQLRKQLQADAPQLMQCFLFHANVLGALAGRRARVPHVLSGIRVAEHARAWHLALARVTDRWIERHVCVSHQVRDFSASAGHLPPEKLVVIPNGVDVARFAAARPCDLTSLGLAPGRRALVSIGRLETQKGLDWFVPLLPRVFAQLPEHDWVIVGEGPKRHELERAVAQLGLKGRVHFLGFRHDVPEILAASELLLLPSRWEGMPNVVLEAMAAGKPVVATDVAGVAELLGPAAEPQTASSDDPQAFVNKTVAIASQSQLAATLGQENQAGARAHFSYEQMVDAYQRLFAAVLDDPKSV